MERIIIFNSPEVFKTDFIGNFFTWVLWIWLWDWEGSFPLDDVWEIEVIKFIKEFIRSSWD
jgi:hypothetical protein